jgi:hypothetical protein
LHSKYFFDKLNLGALKNLLPKDVGGSVWVLVFDLWDIALAFVSQSENLKF